MITNLPKCDVHSYARISDTHCKEAIGKRTKVQGWVRAIRKMKTTVFVEIFDGSTTETLQVVLPSSCQPSNLTSGSSIVTEGELVVAPNGRNELHTNEISVIGTSDVTDNYPFLPRTVHSQDYIRQYLHFRPRTRIFSSVLRLRDIASFSMIDHLRKRGFISVNTPILTSNDCEGAGETFYVKPDSLELLNSMKQDNVPEDNVYFRNKAYLTVSGQLHLEVVARALTKVYTFGPTFRAENTHSRLHLSEFYMIEAELAFIDTIEELMKEVELLIKSTAKEILDKGAADMRTIKASEPDWLNKKFACLTYDNAYDILKNHADQLTTGIDYGDVLSKEQELFLVKHNDNIPTFIINWPKENKPFYMKECTDDSSKVAAMDLLVSNVGELVGGSIREDNYEKLKLKLPKKVDLSWYLELRKHGNVPTGGFGMGFERFLQFFLGIPNIKDTIPFPRWPHNCNL
ncbi:hypothetical protein KM043_005850 [Ampulex compressa]|nr:hypothetical protein KM043_005850 [Ampulex compressa]